MRLTVLGSGTGWFRVERSAPSYLLSLDEFHFLLDLGPGSLRQLLRLGFTLNDISGIFISHFHPDHVTDLIPFLFATRYNLGYTRLEKVFLIAHESFARFHEGLKAAFGSWVEPKEGLIEYFLVPDTDFYEFELKGFRLKTAKVNHNPESLALRVEFKGKSLIYSGDTGYTESIIKLAEGGDLLILECANGDGVYVPQHLGPEDVARIAMLSKVKRVLISHLYPHSEPVPVEVIKKHYSGEVILAEDLIVIDFTCHPERSEGLL
jgi:ribonuclease BN (tRNA processing enzyme)